MKKLLAPLIIFFSFSTVQAETVYLTDSIKFPLRSSEHNRSKILRMLPSGTSLTVISKNEKTGYTKVLYKDIEGYILTRHTLSTPTNSWYRNQAEKKLELLETTNQKSLTELKALKNNNSSAEDDIKTLTEERDKLNKELQELKFTAANSIQLKQQRDQLQEHVVTVERELQKVTRDNQALEDSSQREWFLRGGILALVGVIMGFLLPKISWRRRTSSWDTF